MRSRNPNHSRLIVTLLAGSGFVALTIGAGIVQVVSLTPSESWNPGEIPNAVLPINAPDRQVSSAAIAAHQSITEYTGPETCVACHREEAEDMHGSVHYQQTGPTPNVPNIPGYAGERGFGDIGINTYCGTHVSSSRATCATCHVGNGRFPSPVMSDEQLNNIDCMMCHQDAYKRTPAGPFKDATIVGEDGQPRVIQVPIEDETGFDYMPDEVNMAVSAVEAAQTVHLPTRASCLRCHATASGSDGGKRGDLSSVTVAPPRSSDVHMSPQGANLACINCHSVGGHRVRGRGLDLRPNDVPERFTCESCHGTAPHDSTSRNTHAARVACQSCHIPTFAKDISTEMERDWNHPFYSPAACSGQGGWKPEEIRASNVVPTYQWFDGTSEVIVLGETPAQNEHGEYVFGRPLGEVNSPGAKLYPMKEHLSSSGRLTAILGDIDGDGLGTTADLDLLAACIDEQGHSGTCQPSDLDASGVADVADYALMQLCPGGTCGTPGEIIPHSTFTFFTTGDFPAAIEAGMDYAGMRGQWEQVPVHTFQTINHGVEDSDSALNCGACHASLSGGPLRMNLVADLGYELKGPRSTVCYQCHGWTEEKPFRTVHDIHVKDKDFDCSWCHTFSRPERNLIMP
jgi:hypothetical protein